MSDQDQTPDPDMNRQDDGPGQTGARRAGAVALIGRPNAGKSTLLNKLVGEKIAIVSDKPQTTRTRISGVLTRPEGQIVFLDTPGIHKPGYSLNRRMMSIVSGALSSVDLILLMIDATKPMGSGDRFVLDMLKRVGTPAFLVPNKVDAMRDKSRLFPLIEAYVGEREFAEVIPVSALKGDGVELLVGKAFEHLPEGPLLFPEDALTDQPERAIAAELVREKLLHVTGEELPYVTAVVTESWEDTETITRIGFVIYVERPSHRKIVIGRGGSRLKEIGSAARADIEKMLGRQVFLSLFVKVREHWRNDERALDEMGISGG
ncbi:MAG TPA: GTPase Era [Blastocatellia bacterium]|nr:GTPase Era [Blastocatellia bacterium]